MVKTWTVFVDDNLLAYSPATGSNTWSTGKGNSELFINGSTHDAIHSRLSFAYSFYGKSLSWTGVLWETEDIEFSVSVDGGGTTSCATRGGDEDRNMYQELCSSAFANNIHTVNVTCREQDAGSPVSIDYAVFAVDSDDEVPPGMSPGMYLLTDDQDSGITYSGNWTQDSSNPAYASDGITRRPYGGGTHTGSTLGDALSYHFSGTSVTVYGVQMLLEGTLSATLEIDGASRSNLTINGSSEDDDDAMSNKALVSASGLSPGNHELVLTVTQVSGGQSLIVDYILYEPLYENSKPVSGLPTSTSSGSPASTSLSPSGDGPSSSPSKSWIGGVVVAVLAACFLLSGLAYWWWKRRHRHKGLFEIEGSDPKEPMVARPAGGAFYHSPATHDRDSSRTPLAHANSPSEDAGYPMYDDQTRAEHAHARVPSVLYNPWNAAVNNTLAGASNVSRETRDVGAVRDQQLSNTDGASVLPHALERSATDATPPPVPSKGTPLKQATELDNTVVVSQALAMDKKATRHSKSSPVSASPVPGPVVSSQANKLSQFDTKRESTMTWTPGSGERLLHGADVQSHIEARDANSRGDAAPPRNSLLGGGLRQPDFDHDIGSTSRSAGHASRAPESLERNEAQVEELRQRNDVLVREIARLSALPPPAYE